LSKNIKRAIIISISVILVIVAIISTFFIIKYLKEKQKVDSVIEIYSDENIQERLDTDNNDMEDNLMLQIDGETVLGVIQIEKIGFEGLIYEGTSLDTLAKGVGHFESSSYLEGNVCLAAHNTNKFWAKLHTLETGDKITYISFLGTKEYQVTNKTQISETDWSLLENTNENTLTLITCVKGQKEKRLCVQATEIN
jgi:LPXTG-site transpeptidase (sortase) family protein